MPRSSFPRKNFPLVPKVLAGALDMRAFPSGVAKAAVATSTLFDESIWINCSEREIERFYALVLENLELSKLPSSIADEKLPWPNGLNDIDVLDLELRTVTVLRRYFQQHRLQQFSDLQQITIRELLRAKGFGKTCLLDLLSSLEVYSRDLNCLDSLASLEGQLRIEGISHEEISQDPRFSRLLCELVNGNQKQLLSSQVDDEDSKAAKSINATDGFKDLLRKVKQAEASALREELISIAIDFTENQRDEVLVVSKYGLATGVSKTLEEVGQEHGGLTRERVRQICKEFQNKVASKKLFIPAFRKTLSRITEKVPIATSRIVNQLQADGLLDSPFDVHGLPDIAELLTEAFPFEFVSAFGGEYLVPSDQAESFSHVVQRVLHIISDSHGLVHIDKLWTTLGVEHLASLDISKDCFRDLLRDAPDLVWLGKSQDWLTSKSRTVLVVTVLKKILSVTPKLLLTHLRAGARRPHRVMDMNIPDDVIDQLLNSNLRTSVRSGFVVADEQFSIHEHLSPSELILVEVLREIGGIAEREVLEQRLIERGLPERSIYSYLRYSPIIARVNKGVYCLRGTEQNPEIESIDDDFDAYLEAELAADDDILMDVALVTDTESSGQETSHLHIETEQIEHLFDNLKRTIDASLESRDGQAIFRSQLLVAYENTCAITGCKVVEVLEAAHIIPYMGPQSNFVNNGLLLRCDIHTLFDRELLALDPSTYQIVIDKSLDGTEYAELAGRDLFRPPSNELWPSIELLRVRFDRLMKRASLQS